MLSLSLFALHVKYTTDSQYVWSKSVRVVQFLASVLASLPQRFSLFLHYSKSLTAFAALARFGNVCLENLLCINKFNINRTFGHNLKAHSLGTPNPLHVVIRFWQNVPSYPRSIISHYPLSYLCSKVLPFWLDCLKTICKTLGLTGHRFS